MPSIKTKFLMIEKVMTFVFRAMDTFEAVKRGYAKAKEANPTVKVAPKKKKTLDRITVTKKIKTVPSGKKIKSILASQMLVNLKASNMKPITKKVEIDGKKSLAWVVWALGVAEKTKLQKGISVHDVSSFLYHAAEIEIYPINVSRMVHDHSNFIMQVSQEKKTKRYLLTESGKKMAQELKLIDV
ncbi:MAG: hypothetical protein O2897_05275 [bacterium]|nr:hypothetical protein [bacterium]